MLMVFVPAGEFLMGSAGRANATENRSLVSIQAQ